MNITIIRKATIDDTVHIALIGRITFKESFGHLFENNGDLPNYLNKTFSVSKIKNSIQKEKNSYFIAFVNELPVGYAKLKLNSSSEFINNKNISQLQKIYVLKDFLGLKIGKQLQQAVFDKVLKTETKKVWLSVWTGNKRAIDFYRKNSWNDIGKHKFSIGVHSFEFLAMSRNL